MRERRPIYKNLISDLDLRTVGAEYDGYIVQESEIDEPIFPRTGRDAEKVVYRSVVKTPNGERYVLFSTYEKTGEPYSFTARPIPSQ